jgi:hydrogenase expression/formation protein HypC
MCYAIPAKIIKMNIEEATVDYGGIIRVVNVSLLTDLDIGDFVLIHAGFAIEKLEKKFAEESLEIIKQDLSRFAKEDLKFFS